MEIKEKGQKMVKPIIVTGKSRKWNKESMQQFLDDHNYNGKIVDCWYEDYGYQNKLKAKIITNGIEEIVVWNNFKRRKNFSTPIPHLWTQKDAENFLLDMGFTPIATTKFVDVDTPIDYMDRNGFKYSVSISNIKQYRNNHPQELDELNISRIYKNNPYANENIKLYCEIFRPDYVFLDDYNKTKNCKEKMLFKYNGDLYGKNIPREFYITLDHFINNNGGITGLNISGEANRIAGILRRDKIPFSLEYTFPNTNISSYRFDFAIYDSDKKLKLLLEYDSVLHFEHIENFNSNVDFHRAQERDREKNKFCLMNKIPLYRIPYWELYNIKSYEDCIQEKFRVKNKWHNDIINPNKN